MLRSSNALALLTFACVLLLLLVSSCRVDASSGSVDIISSSQSQSGVEGDLLPTDDPIPPEPHRTNHNIMVKHPDDERWLNEGANKVHPTMNMNPHEEMRCIVCRQVLMPTLIRIISQKAGTMDHKDLVFGELEKLAKKHVYDMVSKSTVEREAPEEAKASEVELDKNIHNYMSHLMWDDHMGPQLIALADVWVQQPRRRHWFRRLINHAICPCHDGKDILRLDHGIDKYIMNHVAATMEASRKYKLGHEYLMNDARSMGIDLNAPGHDTRESEEDRKKKKTATSVGKIWVNADPTIGANHRGIDAIQGADYNAHTAQQEGPNSYEPGTQGYFGGAAHSPDL
jgi:hypothetical protein